MTLDAPQVIVLIILTANLVRAYVKDGEPKEGHYSASCVTFDLVIWVALLVWGGFF